MKDLSTRLIKGIIFCYGRGSVSNVISCNVVMFSLFLFLLLLLLILLYHLFEIYKLTYKKINK